MRIHLLGTGGAEGVPALYSDSRVSSYAREHGGRDLRTRSAALIDGVLKVDLGPDTLAQLHRDRLDARDWEALIFTHSHEDHLSISTLQYFVWPFNDEPVMPFPIYGNDGVLRRIQAAYPDWPFELIQTHSFQPFSIGDYRVTPIHAFHLIVEEDAHNLIFEKDGKSFLYATDTGLWTEETWAYLDGIQLDGLVIEGTEGAVPTEYAGHLDIGEVIQVVGQLRERGSLREGAPVYTTHHSHRGEMTHAELEAALAPHQIAPGYDGLSFEV